MENVGDTSLPHGTSVELSSTVKGALRWAQIGPDAATKLLQSLLESRFACCRRAVTSPWWVHKLNSLAKDGMEVPAKMGLDVIDLFPIVGNFLQAPHAASRAQHTNQILEPASARLSWMCNRAATTRCTTHASCRTLKRMSGC